VFSWSWICEVVKEVAPWVDHLVRDVVASRFRSPPITGAEGQVLPEGWDAQAIYIALKHALKKSDGTAHGSYLAAVADAKAQADVKEEAAANAEAAAAQEELKKAQEKEAAAAREELKKAQEKEAKAAADAKAKAAAAALAAQAAQEAAAAGGEHAGAAPGNEEVASQTPAGETADSESALCASEEAAAAEAEAAAELLSLNELSADPDAKRRELERQVAEAEQKARAAQKKAEVRFRHTTAIRGTYRIIILRGLAVDRSANLSVDSLPGLNTPSRRQIAS